jgi:AraC family transcriptional regulator, transcriptional activator of pobA
MSHEQLPLHDLHNNDDSFFIIPLETEIEQTQSPLPHRHTFYQLCIVTGGRGEHFIDFQPYPVRANNLYFITPGQVHYWQLEIATRGYAILFGEDFLLANQSEPSFLRSLDFYHRIDHSPMLELQDSQAIRFNSLAQELLNEYQTAQFGRRRALQALLQLVLVEAQRHYFTPTTVSKQKRGYNIINEFLKLVDLHFQTRTMVAEYAELLGITTDHLSELTRQVTGLNSSVHIQRRRLLEAKRLLVHTNQTVSEIAYGLNFKDPSYFSRFFRRETNQTPQEFRQEFMAKYNSYKSSL